MRTINQQTPLYNAPQQSPKPHTCKCGIQTFMSYCVVCQIDSRHPGLKEFAMSIRGMKIVRMKKSRSNKKGISPFTPHWREK